MTSREIPFYRIPLEKSEMQALNTRSNLLGLLQSLGHLGLLAVFGAGAVYFQIQEQWLSMVACIALYGFCAAFMINAVHELVHESVFKSSTLNYMFVHVFSFLGWINHYQFWASHTEHHKYTLNPPDDLEVTLPARYSKKGFFKTGFINPWGMKWSFMGTLKKCFGTFSGEWELKTCNNTTVRRRIVWWARLLMLGHISVAAVSIYYGYWVIPILISCGSNICTLPFQLCNSTQHAGLMDNVNDFRLSCRTTYLSPILRFLYWHMNFHIEHHMFAAVPCYRLGKLHKRIQKDLPPCKNLQDAWAEIFAIQKRQEQEPDYQYRQDIPDNNAAALLETQSEHVLASDTSDEPFKVWECKACAFVYNEAKGLPDDGIAPGTRYEDIPEDWSCPDCGVAKKHFRMRVIEELVA